jgi:uncharacterized protein (TIGR02678 family)
VTDRLGSADLQLAARKLLMDQVATAATCSREEFAAIRRHRDDLVPWFREQMGYHLVVGNDFARLHKAPLYPLDATQPARNRNQTPFDRRRYAQLALVLAVLDLGEEQVTISHLAEGVIEICQVEELEVPDFQERTVRLAFVDAVRFLVDLGALGEVDGEDRQFIDEEGDVLYDVNRRAVSELLRHGWTFQAASSGSSGAGGFDYPDTPEGRGRRVRHTLMRRLVEEPVLYYDSLSEDEIELLRGQRRAIRRELLTVVGLHVEVRREGLLCLDPANELSDERFPGNSSEAHAAILLADELGLAIGGVEGSTDRLFEPEELLAITRRLLERYGRYWSRVYREEERGPQLLLERALDILVRFEMVQRVGGGVRAKPTVARYQPAATVVGRQESLF